MGAFSGGVLNSYGSGALGSCGGMGSLGGCDRQFASPEPDHMAPLYSSLSLQDQQVKSFNRNIGVRKGGSRIF